MVKQSQQRTFFGDSTDETALIKFSSDEEEADESEPVVP